MPINLTSGYQPPGVYVSQQTGVITPVSPSVPATVALVGPTVGYSTYTDTLTLSTSFALALTQEGIALSSVTVTDALGTVYSPTNYTATQTGTGSVATSTIELTAGSTVPTNQPVYVSYHYTDSNYFLPHRFTNFNQIQSAYGVGYNAAGTLISPITFAAQCLYANGSPQVVVQPTTDIGTTATRSGLSTAYPNLESLTDVYLIVPVASGIGGTAGSPGDVINVASDLAAYISSLLPSNQYAMGLYGPDSTSSVPSTTIAAGVDNERVVLFYPNSLLAYNSLAGKNITVGGFNLAAAAAGFLGTNSVQQGLTNQVISGFSGIPTAVGITMTTSALNTLSASGVSVMVPNITNKSFYIRQGVTTNPSSANTAEISVVRAGDYLIYDIVVTLRNSQLIGAPTTAQTPSVVQSVVQGVLEANVSSGAILGYAGLSAVMASTAPTVVSVSFSYAPSYPLNYIEVSYQINTTTGAVQQLAA